MNHRQHFLAALGLMLGTAALNAQQTTAPPSPKPSDQPRQQFSLHFVAKELDGNRVINSRDYLVRTAVPIDSSDWSTNADIRTGSRVPVATGIVDVGKANTTQFTYLDVGINFDCHRIHLSGERFAVDVAAEISSYNEVNAGQQPIIRQNKWHGSVSIPIGKTETIFSSDDVLSKRTLQIDLTVTPVK